jgi:hypothetical protein
MSIPISHKVYDTVLDNDWNKYPVITLYRMGTSYADIYVFAAWCARLLGEKVRVRFPEPNRVTIEKASRPIIRKREYPR